MHIHFSHLCAVCLLPCVVCTCDQECAYHGHSRCRARALSLSSCIPHSIPHFPPSLLRALVVSRAFAPLSPLSISLSHIHLRSVPFMRSSCLSGARSRSFYHSLSLFISLSVSVQLSSRYHNTSHDLHMLSPTIKREVSGTLGRQLWIKQKEAAISKVIHIYIHIQVYIHMYLSSIYTHLNQNALTLSHAR